MNWVAIIIIGLVLLSWAQYTYPDKVKIISQAYDPLNSKLGITAQPTEKSTLVNPSCPDTYDPVCASNITYQNTCKAGQAGKTSVTPGACA